MYCIHQGYELGKEAALAVNPFFHDVGDPENIVKTL